MNKAENLDQLTIKDRETKFDLKPLLEQCMGDFSLMNDFVEVYRGNILEFIGKVKLHLKEENFKEIEYATRKLKYGFMLLKNEEMTVLITEMHTISKTRQDVVELNHLYDSFVDRYPSIDDAIQRELVKLEKKAGNTF